MSWIHNLNRDSIQSSPLSSPSSSPSSSSNSKFNPAIFFLIAIVTIVFIFCGLLHLLIRFIMKNRPSFISSQSNQYPEMSNSDTFQRQLHQLFELHDSGLDQELIDALPIFQYKEIMGLKEPFDCPVCLSEFFEEDKLRLIPHCSHAFHLDCIDTWLLSNSTCPLCRRSLSAPELVIENPVSESEVSTSTIGSISSEVVLSVRLGKFRSTDNGKGEVGVSGSNSGFSSSDLGARRCFSMGASYQYVVGDSVLHVAFSSKRSANGGSDLSVKRRSEQGRHYDFAPDGDVEGKRISAASKNESYSVSKIWLWSKKGKFLGSSNTQLGDTSTTTSVDMDLAWTNIV